MMLMHRVQTSQMLCVDIVECVWHLIAIYRYGRNDIKIYSYIKKHYVDIHKES